MMSPLHHGFKGWNHVVTKIIKTEFIICTVSYVSTVGLAFTVLIKIRSYDIHRHSQHGIDFSHPFRVSSCQVIVYGNDMDILACKAVQIGWKGCNKGFTLTGFHFRNIPLVKEDSSNHLDIENAQTKCSLAYFSCQGKGFREQIIQRFTVSGPCFKFLGLLNDFRFGKLFVLTFQTIDLDNKWLDGFQQSVIGRSKKLFRKVSDTQHLRITPTDYL